MAVLPTDHASGMREAIPVAARAGALLGLVVGRIGGRLAMLVLSAPRQPSTVATTSRLT